MNSLKVKGSYSFLLGHMHTQYVCVCNCKCVSIVSYSLVWPNLGFSHNLVVVVAILMPRDEGFRENCFTET